MLKPSAKGVVWGTVVFFVLLALSSLLANLFGIDLTQGLTYWVYLATWIVPGYVAASVSRTNGILNGAVVGLTVGILVGVISQIFFTNPPPNVEQYTSGAEVGFRMGMTATVLCSIGGLIWDIVRRFRGH